MELLPVCDVVADRAVAANELHVADLALAGVDERSVREDLVAVPMRLAALAGEHQDQRVGLRREDAALPLAAVSRVEIGSPILRARRRSRVVHSAALAVGVTSVQVDSETEASKDMRRAGHRSVTTIELARLQRPEVGELVAERHRRDRLRMVPSARFVDEHEHPNVHTGPLEECRLAELEVQRHRAPHRRGIREAPQRPSHHPRILACCPVASIRPDNSSANHSNSFERCSDS